MIDRHGSASQKDDILPKLANGELRIAGTDRRIGLFELARRQPGRRIVVDSTSSVDDATWPNGCHIAEVEIDPDTGAVVVDRYWSVNDVGRVVNPMIVIGQLEGGAVQGIGQALCEAFVHDPKTGQPLTATFMDYTLPTAVELPSLEIGHQQTPTPFNPLGTKGVGESGVGGTLGSLCAAIENALPEYDLHLTELPLSPHAIWLAIEEARTATAEGAR